MVKDKTMTETELRNALEEKGYRYDEDRGPGGYLWVYAVKRDQRTKVGVKALLLAGSLDYFKRNEAYTKL